MRKASYALVCLAWLLASSSVAGAQVTTIPNGLSPGDEYRLIFVTSTTRDATSTDIADYNTFVTGVANLVPELVALNAQWFAVGATTSTSGRTNTGILAAGDVPVFRLDDQIVVNDAFGLWAALTTPLLNPVEVNESGAVEMTDNRVFSGLQEFGNADNPLGGTNVNWGRFVTTGGGWIRANNSPAASEYHFYAVSDTLTVPPPVPALGVPGAVVLVFALGLMGLTFLRRACV